MHAALATDPKAIDDREYLRNFEDFVASLEEGRLPKVNAPEARRSIELILAIYESAMNGGKRVHLPLKKTPELRSLQ